MSVSRRDLFTAALLLAPAGRILSDAQAPAVPARLASFPGHPPELAQEMVGVAHRDLARVKALLARHATLSLAAWDWGFGDWEDALGAASHVGQREIAAVLLAHGARPTIFSAAMLGQLDVVKSFITAAPGIERIPGPHGIPLLRHAMAGGPAARAVVEYLQTIPGADSRPAASPIEAAELTPLMGDYEFGPAADDRIRVEVSTSGVLTFTRQSRSPRNLTHLGDRVFFPVGAPDVRIAFRPSAGAGMRLIVTDGDLVVEARRRR